MNEPTDTQKPNDEGGVALSPIVGRLVQAGKLHDTNGDTVHGVLIDCGQTVLKSANLPLYEKVQVLNFRSAPDEILKFLHAGIPAKTFREVYERLREELEPTRIYSPNTQGDGRREGTPPHQ
jgi:hypothetical protein